MNNFFKALREIAMNEIDASRVFYADFWQGREVHMVHLCKECAMSILEGKGHRQHHDQGEYHNVESITEFMLTICNACGREINTQYPQEVPVYEIYETHIDLFKNEFRASHRITVYGDDAKKEILTDAYKNKKHYYAVVSGSQEHEEYRMALPL